MSAIWGMVDFLNKIENEDITRRMEEPYHAYKIDVYQNNATENALFGYGGQYFTKEAEKEILPILSGDGKILFTADAVLDNREELLSLSGLEPKEWEETPDGTLMYLIYRKYGEESFLNFLGTYAFACYDTEKKEVLLVTDAVGSRSLYYLYENGKLYFSTLMKPILSAFPAPVQWNYRLLCDYLALDNLALYTEAEETPYQMLYKVAPGQIVRIGEQKIAKEDYWKPKLNYKLKGVGDEEIKTQLIRLFDTCVSCVMRSSGKTGILLSGGLDSTSVACFAAPKLHFKGEDLYSYTSVPEKGYISKEDPYYITDERQTVEKTRGFLGNLKCTYMDLPDLNGFDLAGKYMTSTELPYKSLQNIGWIYACNEKAAQDGCRILLSGKFGNTTISFGGYENQFYALLRKGRLAELYKEVNAFAKRHTISRKRIYKDILLITRKKVFGKKKKTDELFKNVYVNPKLVKRYETGDRFILYQRLKRKSQTGMGRVLKPYLAYRPAFTQIGEFETHLSLAAGVLQRDPTRDRRLIEFCLQLPDRQFVYRGVERRLVREYLKEYLPKEILEDNKHRGLQSADMTYRIAKNWRSIYKECMTLMNDQLADELLDLAKLKGKLEAYKEKVPAEEGFELMKVLYSLLLVKYVRLNNES